MSVCNNDKVEFIYNVTLCRTASTQTYVITDLTSTTY